jgi:hopanoid-associated phosphorylase
MVFAETVRGAGMPRPSTIVAVTSLAREALVARGSGVSVVCSQGERLGAALHAAIHPGVSGIISFGISGGLHPELVAGDWIVASAVRYRDRVIETDSKWRQELSKRLPGAVLADIVGSDTMVPTPSEKSHLHRTTGAFAVDMESYLAAEIAATHRIPFAACRVIIDAAHRALPSAAGSALDSNGSVNVFAVMRSVLQTPSQLPDLFRAAFDAFIAERALRKGRKLLGPGFGSPFVDGRPAERDFAGQSDVSNDFLRPPICETT